MHRAAIAGCVLCIRCTLRTPVSSLSSVPTIRLFSVVTRPPTRNSLLNKAKLYLRFGVIRKVGTVETKRASVSLRNASWRDLRNIFALSYPYKGRIFLGLTFLGVSSFVFLSLPIILGKLVDEFDSATKKGDKKEDERFMNLVRFFKNNPIALFALMFTGAAAICARAYCMHTAGQLVINDLRTKVFESVLRQEMAFFDRNKVGEIVSRLSTDALIVGYSVSINLSEGARALITFTGSAALMVYTSPSLCLNVGCVIPILVGAFMLFGKLQRKYTMQMQEAVAGANQVATERLTNVRTVRMLVAEEKELRAYKRKMHDIWLVARREGFARGLMFGGFQFTGYTALSFVLYFGSNYISQGLLTYGDLSSFILYAVFCATSLSNMSGFYSELMKGLGASSRLFELRYRQPVIPVTGGIKKDGVQDGIRVESVCFAYPDRPPTFNDITFFIPAGKVTALVGPSGSGKSTLANLLLRLYDPTCGRIMVDDVDLKKLDPSHWRRQIGTVGQEPVLFSTTIRENIVYGAEKPELISDEKVHEAASQSNALEFILEFPRGFETLVGDQGASMLSGGQKQRVAIARALVTSPSMLIMDEATSALDATSEYLVRKALGKLLQNSKQTVVIIAHRLSTIKHADQIVVLDKGTVAETGTFEELMEMERGTFKKLVEKQTIGWREENF